MIWIIRLLIVFTAWIWIWGMVLLRDKLISLKNIKKDTNNFDHFLQEVIRRNPNYKKMSKEKKYKIRNALHSLYKKI